MKLSGDVLGKLGVSHADVDKYLEPLTAAMARYGIASRLRIAHFLAQVVHESGHFKHVEENMNYSVDGLLNVFGKYFPSRSLAQTYARKPMMIGNHVYASRMGNGDEASGDGYLYRGRGLMQLTGKSNYKAFSNWLEEDVVAAPERVAQHFASHSAVYFWDSHHLNRLADTDDIRRITEAINGGLKGFDERRLLLEKAKAALRDEPEGQSPAAELDSTDFKPAHQVAPLQLNLRSAPRVTPATWVATLHQGCKVEVVSQLAEGWVQIRVQIGHAVREGFVAEQYLAPLPISRGGFDPVEAPVPERVFPGVHLQQNLKAITRKSETGRAYPLGEGRRPHRTASKPSARAAQLLKIIDYLDCAAAAHRRYKAAAGSTCSDIYAYDYCHLAGVYLPRVWWTERALLRITGGESVPVAYGQSVRELNANALHDWLEDHGPGFGWYRELDLTTLQAAADAGEVCLIVSRRKDPNLAGEIALVVPQQDGFQARHDAAGRVTRPVQSMASGRNRKYTVSRSAWWLNDQYQSFAFWRHP
ncbi:hypothetical protein PS662_03561 [Pseudomonas fluorescens]|uniref:SH3b domain-containing protein n=1 Tax=Pseudomonas fluorescens TaxID=294 RepID=A0A5E6UJ94_PSEFL|nr:glycoside hydrolase family 19 protein [Pseudomonas fluorescens]VVN05233.1 hypothetical protein PS662_03561 [Pseudomonas fluorescens]